MNRRLASDSATALPARRKWYRPAGWPTALAAVLLGGQILLRATPAAAAVNEIPAVAPPMPPAVKSPVDQFRELLAMSVADRQHALSNRPPEIQARILTKLREYDALPATEREARLRATELRFYLQPVLAASATNRADLLAPLPADIRERVKARFDQQPPLPPALPRFLELPQAEKAKVVELLGETEREQMERTLREFSQLPPAQQNQCIRSFARFATLSPDERRAFLQSAARWQAMSAEERDAWRRLVHAVQRLPPLPPGRSGPPLPPAVPAPRSDVSSAATDRH